MRLQKRKRRLLKSPGKEIKAGCADRISEMKIYLYKYTIICGADVVFAVL